MKKILLFHMNPLRVSEISALCAGLGIAAETVTAERYGEPIGRLAGMTVPEGFGMPSPSLSKIPMANPSITSEMMVFAGMDQQEVFAFLQTLRESGISSIDLKAVLTPFNASWTATDLFGELKKEHEAMTSRGK